MEKTCRKIKFSPEENDAVLAQATNWTRALVDYDDLSNGGSVIPIRLGARNFLATAAHVIKDDHRFELASQEGEESISDFTNKCFDLQTDVGVLELDASNAAKISGFVPENQVLVQFDYEEECDVFITGFPGVDSFQMPGNRIAQRGNSVRTITVPRAEWPDDDDLVEPTDVGSDFFVRYPDDMEKSIFWSDKAQTESGSVLSKPPHPAGMSGGGIWLTAACVQQKSGVWQPCVRLVGLEVGYLEKSQMLCCKRIGRWLDLIANNYPDLQESILSIVKRN